MIDEPTIGGGLLPLAPDNRDFSHDMVFGSLAAEDLPVGDFIVGLPPKILNQHAVDFCTAYSGCHMSAIQEGVSLDPSFAFATIKKIQGNPLSWGSDLRFGAKAFTSIGFIEDGQAPLSWETNGRDVVADWKNWPQWNDLVEKAAKHKKLSYFTVDGPYDTFDNFRAALWQHKDEKCAIYTGATWRSQWSRAQNGVVSRENFAGGIGHCFILVGQKNIDGVPHLVGVNSGGETSGDGGLFYFPRETINRDFLYGAYMFHDMPPEEVKKIIADLVPQGLPENKLGILQRLFDRIAALFAKITLHQ